MNLKKTIPIQLNELPKFLTTSFVMVLTLYIYSILRGTKDALIIDELGAELISTLKLWGVLPFAILMMVVYTKLCDFFKRSTMYHVLVGFFVGFFVMFNFVFYPNAESIHFDMTSAIEAAPAFKYPLMAIGSWSFSLFYIMSELWGSMMLSLMFWQLANQINTIDEAKRFYPLFGFLGQIGLVTSGILMGVFNDKAFFPEWKDSLNLITISVAASGAIISGLIVYLGAGLVGYETINGAATKKKKAKMGLIESFKYVFSSKYIGLITLLVVSYGISINLVEGVWKKMVGTYFMDKAAISAFTGQVQVYTGIATFVAMLAGSAALRIFSWRTVAIATPIIILVTGAPFFGFVIFQDFFANHFGLDATEILFAAVIFGATQNVLSKAVKYSFFDPTKEMSYIPLDDELKSKGKAAADVIGGRLGKSGGAIIQFMMLAFVAGSTLTSIAPSLSVIFMIIMVIWIYAVFSLSVEFKKKSKEAEAAK